jgi:predicted small metal-binding protein
MLNVQKGRPMASQITCECGYVIRGANDDEVVARTREHLRRDHPELADTVTADMIRSWVEVVP